MRSWGPFPDTRPALLQAHHQGLKLIIVSNSEHSLMDHTLRQLDLPFHDVVLAEDAGAYKPDERPLRMALERLGEPPERVIHTAFGFKYDIGPAQRLGMQTAWINRHVEPAPGSEKPDHEWRDLWGLARLMGGAGARDRVGPGAGSARRGGELQHLAGAEVAARTARPRRPGRTTRWSGPLAPTTLAGSAWPVAIASAADRPQMVPEQ